LALGAVLEGAALAALGGALTLALARHARRGRAAREADPLEPAIVRTAERFAAAARSRGSYYYVRGKLRGDPSTRAVAALRPLANVLDLGCGRGQLAVLLLESGAAARVRGVDWDAPKVALARSASEGLSAEFVQGDVRTAAVDPADTVLLIDVLHYFDRATQDALLDRAAALVRPGGMLLVREADRGRGARSLLTRVQEGIGTATRFNRGERVLFRDVARELVPRLEAAGMRCEVQPCWGRTPLSNVLLIARRPRAVGPVDP
jgi:2-polyprenyl-3-methyl-5-hydroxy-6-metoxy-1,4-benzoquinol methylase